MTTYNNKHILFVTKWKGLLCKIEIDSLAGTKNIGQYDMVTTSLAMAGE